MDKPYFLKQNDYNQFLYFHSKKLKRIKKPLKHNGEMYCNIYYVKIRVYKNKLAYVFIYNLLVYIFLGGFQGFF